MHSCVGELQTFPQYLTLVWAKINKQRKFHEINKIIIIIHLQQAIRSSFSYLSINLIIPKKINTEKKIVYIVYFKVDTGDMNK